MQKSNFKRNTSQILYDAVFILTVAALLLLFYSGKIITYKDILLMAAVLGLVTYILIQMLENQLLVPKIMERAVGLNPVIVIIGVSIGANMMGIVGALLAIPFISFLIVIYKSLEAQK